MPERTIDARYRDPLDEVWLATAARCGLRVVRSAEVFASYDGAGTLTLSTPEHFDADDSLAQFVLHELCHALVQGEASLALPDFGLDNRSERDLSAEHACHRLQAALLAPHGLRRVLAPTTEHRAYYDALPDDPLDDGDDARAATTTDGAPTADAAEVLAAARAGFERATRGPWAVPLREALVATAAIVRVARAFGDERSLFRRTDG
ncbi:MAG: hypothetical protein H6825_01935 [Planctomycetes bacterium]|nr:hypothetical protein [Planctomycetota bacterium]